MSTDSITSRLTAQDYNRAEAQAELIRRLRREARAAQRNIKALKATVAELQQALHEVRGGSDAE